VNGAMSPRVGTTNGTKVLSARTRANDCRRVSVSYEQQVQDHPACSAIAVAERMDRFEARVGAGQVGKQVFSVGWLYATSACHAIVPRGIPLLTGAREFERVAEDVDVIWREL